MPHGVRKEVSAEPMKLDGDVPVVTVVQSRFGIDYSQMPSLWSGPQDWPRAD